MPRSSLRMSGDAYHITAPDPDGGDATLCMKNALEDARSVLTRSTTSCHGTSHQAQTTKSETRAIKAVFGKHAVQAGGQLHQVLTGHLLGGAGGVEAAIIALTIKTVSFPPTINYDSGPGMRSGFCSQRGQKSKR